MQEHEIYTLRATMRGWDLQRDGERLALFETFFEAEDAALNAADLSRDRGRLVEVYVLTERGNINLLHKPASRRLRPHLEHGARK